MPVLREKSKSLKGILEFCIKLESRLSVAFPPKDTGSLKSEIRDFLFSFPNNFPPSSHVQEIESYGTKIWNLCTRLRRDIESDSSDEIHEILLLTRILAFLMLDCAHQCGKATSENLPRLMRTGVKSCKSCIEYKNSELALKVLGKVSSYQVLLKNFETDITKDDRDICEKLLAEYYVLRTAVAWQMEQFDIAEHMYHKSTSSMKKLEANTTESFADVLHDIGRGLLNRKQYKLSVIWSRRAFDIISGWQLDELSNDASELRISILQALIKALIGVQDKESLIEARRWLDMLEREVGDKIVVLLLNLEIISAPINEYFDSDAYSDVIQRIMRAVYLTEPNFKLLMFHIRKLNDKNPSLGIHALEDLLSTRVLVDGRDEYIEKILVTRIWMDVGHRDSEDGTQRLKSILSKLLANIKKPISSQATLAAQTVCSYPSKLIKRSDSSKAIMEKNRIELLGRLAKHPIFEQTGESNMARISRKLLLCALAKKEIENAREIISTMTEVEKNEPMSRFLMYKIAVRCDDNDMAVECLHKISSSLGSDPTLLYACCLDAKQMGNKPQLLVTLQLVLEKFSYNMPPGFHLPSLLRLTISLMNGMIEESPISGTDPNIDIVEKICAAFESVLTWAIAASSIYQVRCSTKSVDHFWTLDEHEWFSKNSYNLAIKHLSDWYPKQIVRLLKSCLVFIDQHLSGVNEQVSDDLSLRKLFCEFSVTTALIVLARAEDNIETRLQNYLEIRRHVASFETVLKTKEETIDEQMTQDLNRKLSILVSFDFEAACQLKAWDDLWKIILKANASKNSRVYEIMADCILCADVPTQVLIDTLKKIINEAWKTEILDTAKLAKYMRCLFQIAISENTVLAEQLLDQVHSHAEEAFETDQRYPSEELEWIATRAFNYAVDLYCCHDDERCLNWSGKALNIAQYCMDNGALKRTLQNKLVKMKLDG
ncbi:Sporulation-specific protein 22 [Golovinomyces cichoracearum]|uniref:Sporulation-specific protein 22 n=1 Tax=Golovinomyces cichoracearum TaxID=62708 RepID=A0A420II27_9PEZI|nr:Sporulation-specific protein 22 [Golovinomyces cichoracearum]